MRRGATYQEIQKWVKLQFGFKPKPCWIAHCKEIYGLPLGGVTNQLSDEGAEACPPENQTAIKKAFEHFGMLS